MLRRKFLAVAGLAGARGLRASDPPAACTSWPPDFLANPMNQPLAAALHVDLPAGKPIINRPLWSQMTPRDQDILAAKLQKAYGRMAGRRPSDTRGLLYQAWQHALHCGAGKNIDVDVHACNHFLPWHRAFLYVHEQLLQRELGDSTFRIPVWDWENDPEVPWPYQVLRSVQRTCYAPRIARLPVITDASLTDWLVSASFEEFFGTDDEPGRAVGGVHAFVHANLGLNSYMSWPGSAAGDPVFYAHHANVDRYWIYWWNFYKDKFQPHWPTAPYSFYGPNGRPVCVNIADLMDHTKLGYDYDLPDKKLLFVPTPATTVKAQPAPDSPNDRSVATFDPDSWQRIIAYVKQQLSLGSLNADVELAKKAASDFVEAIRDLVARGNIQLPVFAFARITDWNGGSYYLVEIQPIGKPEESKVIGGFGVFMGDHRMPGGKPMPIRVAPLLTLDFEALNVIAKSLARGFRLVYGKRGSNGAIEGARTPFPVEGFEIRLRP
jgi:hypothetical protein